MSQGDINAIVLREVFSLRTIEHALPEILRAITLLDARIAVLEQRPEPVQQVSIDEVEPSTSDELTISQLTDLVEYALSGAPAEPAQLLPPVDALLSDYGQIGDGYDDITGDLLLDAFEKDEDEAAAVVQVLSATRQRHLSEQLNVEKARLRREHMLTDQANPREASIDRLLGLLTRRGD